MDRFILVIFFVVMGFSTIAQTRDFLPEGYRKLTAQEQNGVQISLALPMYTEDGKKLDQNEAMKAVSGPDYSMQLYGNAEGLLSAIVLVKLSEDDRAKRLREMMSQSDKTGNLKGTKSPGFVEKNLKGESLNLDELKGSIVVLNFWFIGCKPCQIEIPELNELVEKYKGQNVKFIAFALDDQAALERFLTRKEFTYEIVASARNVAATYKVEGYPTHVLIDDEGKTQFFQTGYNGALSIIIDQKIGELLKK
jgi:thiol-disulfide isomerase/thioredoxin